MAAPTGPNIFPINCTGGGTVRIAIPAPPFGLVMKAVVVQLNPDGTAGPPSAVLDGFQVTFYNSAKACPAGAPGVPVFTPATQEPLVNAAVEIAGQLSPTWVIPKSQDRYQVGSTDGGYMTIGIPYINCDAGISDAKGMVYVKIVVGGSTSENKTFGVFMGIQHYRG